MAAPQRWIALLVVVVAAIVGVNRFGATDHPAQAPPAATTTADVVWSHGHNGGSQPTVHTAAPRAYSVRMVHGELDNESGPAANLRTIFIDFE